MILDEAFDLAFRFINEYSVNGTAISPTNGNYIDIKNRMYAPADAVQKRLATIKKIPAQIKISQNPIPNLLGLYGANEVQHFPGTNATYTGAGAKAFSLEVNGPCTLLFEEYQGGAWQNVSGTYFDGTNTVAFAGSIVVSGISSFVNYRGVLTATGEVRLTISALYPMISRYRAFFGYTFANAAGVPLFRPFVPYDLPADYMEFDRMMREYDERQFNENTDYKITNDNKVWLNWYLTGQFIVYYWKYPATITPTTPGTYQWEVSTDAQAIAPYFIGGQAIIPDDSSIGTQLMNMYFALEDGLLKPKATTTLTVESTLWSKGAV